ncbi:hypothetical protein AKJ16_DCAP09312 [Drosera capensis]
MAGKKSSMKFLISKLREVGVTVVKTTEFVQGQTCRWGLARSFLPPARKLLTNRIAEKTNLSFMLEGVRRQTSAFDVLQSVESFFCCFSASCKSNPSSFTVDVFQQIPGTLLVKGSVQPKQGSALGTFSSIFLQLMISSKKDFAGRNTHIDDLSLIS